MLYKLILKTRQDIKVKNVSTNNMSSDTKLSKFQMPKIIWLGAFLGKTLGNLGKKVLLNLAVCLVKGICLN